MADEVKKEEPKCGCGKNAFPSSLKVVLGLAFLVAAVYLLVGRHWWGGLFLAVDQRLRGAVFGIGRSDRAGNRQGIK